MQLNKSLIILILCLALQGCATIGVQPVCRHNAKYQAETVADLTGLPTRIVRFVDRIMWRGHEQAQVKRDGKWRWLRQSCSPWIGEGARENWWKDAEITYWTFNKASGKWSKVGDK